MVELESARTELAGQRLRQGLQTHAAVQSREPALALARQLDNGHDLAMDLGIDPETKLKDVKSRLSTDTLRRLRKIVDVLEDDLGVKLAHGKFARIAGTATTLNSYLALAIAGWNLLESANTLSGAAATVSSQAAIDEKYYHRFYRAGGMFLVECFLFTTPLTFETAWKGTRFLNNRYLYRLRSVSSFLYRLVLSEVHFAIRGLLKSSLRKPEELYSYLVEMTTQTVTILKKQSSDGIGEVAAKVETIVDEFYAFIEDTYQVVVPDVDFAAIVQDVLEELDLSISIQW